MDQSDGAAEYIDCVFVEGKDSTPSIAITNNLIKHQSFVYIQLNKKTVLFRIVQFSISTQFSSI